MVNLFDGLITSKTRIKLLIRFFLNPEAKSYLRELSREFKISSNAVRCELNQLETTKLLTAQKSGRQVVYQANPEHPLFPDLKSMVSKLIGIDKVIEGIIIRLGDLEYAFLMDDYAEGKDSGIIDLLLVGNIDHQNLNDLSKKTERYINRKIRSLVLSKQEFDAFTSQLETRPHILIWKSTN